MHACSQTHSFESLRNLSALCLAIIGSFGVLILMNHSRHATSLAQKKDNTSHLGNVAHFANLKMHDGIPL